ncbi:hypothetical protein H072_31 [Dactylellina haptotyla CBS 200.50]|uniref:Uncharacterized protein n=1 Tax=Dactylellina haptotyla (strain CBS 200.50) TaxID=1284197 RepID=S8C2S5_DACHA|nr:hypothetical protein H072_31 [Dactylellina haptotyla CBS 200.50]
MSSGTTPAQPAQIEDFSPSDLVSRLERVFQANPDSIDYGMGMRLRNLANRICNHKITEHARRIIAPGAQGTLKRTEPIEPAEPHKTPTPPGITGAALDPPVPNKSSVSLFGLHFPGPEAPGVEFDPQTGHRRSRRESDEGGPSPKKARADNSNILPLLDNTLPEIEATLLGDETTLPELETTLPELEYTLLNLDATLTGLETSLPRHETTAYQGHLKTEKMMTVQNRMLSPLVFAMVQSALKETCTDPKPWRLAHSFPKDAPQLQYYSTFAGLDLKVPENECTFHHALYTIFKQVQPVPVGTVAMFETVLGQIIISWEHEKRRDIANENCDRPTSILDGLVDDIHNEDLLKRYDSIEAAKLILSDDDLQDEKTKLRSQLSSMSTLGKKWRNFTEAAGFGLGFIAIFDYYSPGIKEKFLKTDIEKLRDASFSVVEFSNRLISAMPRLKEITNKLTPVVLKICGFQIDTKVMMEGMTELELYHTESWDVDWLLMLVSVLDLKSFWDMYESERRLMDNNEDPEGEFVFAT